jgi:hypothetical protein
MSVELGDEVRHIVTRYRGIAIARIQHLTGPDYISIQPREMTSDGLPILAQAFDEAEVEVVEKGVVGI